MKRDVFFRFTCSFRRMKRHHALNHAVARKPWQPWHVHNSSGYLGHPQQARLSKWTHTQHYGCYSTLITVTFVTNLLNPSQSVWQRRSIHRIQHVLERHCLKSTFLFGDDRRISFDRWFTCKTILQSIRDDETSQNPSRECEDARESLSSVEQDRRYFERCAFVFVRCKSMKVYVVNVLDWWISSKTSSE